MSSYLTLGQYLFDLFKQHGKDLEQSQEFKDLVSCYTKDKLREALKKEIAKQQPKKITIP